MIVVGTGVSYRNKQKRRCTNIYVKFTRYSHMHLLSQVRLAYVTGALTDVTDHGVHVTG